MSKGRHLLTLIYLLDALNLFCCCGGCVAIVFRRGGQAVVVVAFFDVISRHDAQG